MVRAAEDLVNLYRVLAVVRRISRQVISDRRLIALALGAPIVIMTVLALAVRSGPSAARIAVVGRGLTGLAAAAVADRLRGPGLDVVLMPDARVEAAVRDGELDAALRLGDDTLARRLAGHPPRVELLVSGSDPTRVANVMRRMRERLPELAAAMAPEPPPDCPERCAAGPAGPPELTIVPLTGERSDLDYYVSATAPLVVFFFGYLLTAMAFLRERVGGTLERIGASPLRPMELTTGYFGGFLGLALVQAAVVLGFMVWALGIRNAGGWPALATLLVLTAVCAEGLGIFLSTLARTEFQVVQFIPLVILPQALLCGLALPVEYLPSGLHELAWAMPLTHATAAVREIMLRGNDLRALPYLGVLAAFAVGAAFLAALAMRRRAY
ncbi:MAG: ABC transporter permease [Deltaproteobacteria bacterium]|nr:ABC transporter permease [Deltaproteobacteria bacterium]